MKRIELDFSKCMDRSDVHTYLKEQFGFPDYYGNNLDALHDCLEEMTDVEIVVENEENENN